MNTGYPTSKNRVSMGLALTKERMAHLREMSVSDKVSIAEKVGQLVDAEWERRLSAPDPSTEKAEVAA